ncbi:DNA glycosylase [Pontibacillus litoralis JSM 072002]|uniref:Adenine DNA glycosylase n=1 Tax=Pontibacillus litoralis JSM 072002 TaxID=1385512 RepID=A0A0A5G7W5_9BACI|nr:A/G-specific adenine glycosylase [Pontibacillus litoralis]KGX88119.1 DNA glycosylase [Pontibacillus litoralis JSM 072002]
MKNNRSERILEAFDSLTFCENLIQWFQTEQRVLPWRENQDPYRVWVSEIMLQQTKVDTVIPYFNRFIDQFPTLQALAGAEEQQVLKAWEGLGYYSRARNLHSAVQEVVSTYNGQVPNNEKELSSLKGIGPYTKGAILSIAYDTPAPAVDGNVMRVLSRILMIEDDIAKPATRKVFEEVVRELISKEDPSSFNQGLMELGALICTPKKPSCMLCPVQNHCRAFAEGKELQLPIKSSKKKQKKLPYLALILKDERGKVVIQQRPEQGLLANLWEFPMIPLQEVNKEHVASWFKENYGVEIVLHDTVDHIKHTFSHIIWELEVIEATYTHGQFFEHLTTTFVTKHELEQYPLPVSHQKIVKHV